MLSDVARWKAALGLHSKALELAMSDLLAEVAVAEQNLAVTMR